MAVAPLRRLCAGLLMSTYHIAKGSEAVAEDIGLFV